MRLDPTFQRNVFDHTERQLGNPVMRWDLVNARPMKWTGPTLAGKGGSDVAMEGARALLQGSIRSGIGGHATPN